MRENKGEANVHGACVEEGPADRASESYAGNERVKKNKETMLTQESEHRSKKKRRRLVPVCSSVLVAGRSLER